MQNFIYGRKIPKRTIPSNSWITGIGDYDKGGGDYYMSRGMDIRTNPRQLTILPAAMKESGGIVTDFVKWGERVTGRTSSTPNTYFYGDTGNLYKRTSTPIYSLLRTVSSSHGNGMRWFGEDDYLYYTGDKTIGRYGPISNASPTFNDDFLTTLGGVPTNTNSVKLVAASSMYLNHADQAALEITGDIAMEIYIKPASLPTVGNAMELMGKWDESLNHRGYKLDLYGVSGYFGTGSDGDLTISANTTDAPIDSAASGTAGTQSLTATNVSFAQSQYIFIHQTQGSGAGSWQKTQISGYTAGTITTSDVLNFSYASGAQVLVTKQYGNVTINSLQTLTAKAWNGTVGGILSFVANNTLTLNGVISANGCGFRGQANDGTAYDTGHSGEGTGGSGTLSTAANGNGGGGGANGTPGADDHAGSGSGGGNGTTGLQGGTPFGSPAGTDGAVGGIAGSADLTTIVFGGAGGTAPNAAALNLNKGGNGGGILGLFAVTITVNNGSNITANGNIGGAAYTSNQAGSGGGAGGSILLKAQTATLNTNLILASGGAGGAGTDSRPVGGAGGDGRIHIDYLTSYTGTTTPTLTFAQDNTLVTTSTTQVRLGISNNGTLFEYLTQNLINIATNTWQRIGVSWKASTSTANFYFNGNNIGTQTGTKTSISNNVAAFSVGANNTGAGIGAYFDGILNDARLWSTTRTDTQMVSFKDTQLSGSEAGLAGYWEFNNDYADDTSANNTLTAVNTPTFVTDVPFSGPTSRLDIDQTGAGTGQTYTLLNAISESGVNMKTFVPAIDPQKSISVTMGTIGTGDWTLTVHDPYNNVIASQTITHANLPSSGVVEFVFPTVWSPVAGATYHFHLTSSDGTGTVVSNTLNDISTIKFTTYFQFLLTDTLYHPIERAVNIMVIGNGRYVATWDGGTFTPNRLKLPSPWKVRCLAQWNDYIAIGCWKGTSITEFDEGMIFLWNAANAANPNATYDLAVPVPIGGINAMIGIGQTLYFYAGYQGDLMKYILGGDAEKVKRIPKVDDETYVEIFPQALTTWHGIMRMGIAGNSSSTVIQKGAYSYGHRDNNYPDSLNFDFPISTGNYLNTVQVGMLLAEDNKLLMSWRDGTGTGIDVIDPVNNGCQPSATLEEFIVDVGMIWKNKKAPYIRADFAALQTGQSVTLKYKMDRATNWTTFQITPTTPNILTNNGHSSYLLPISEIKVGTSDLGTPDRHNEIQVAIDLGSTSGVSPTLHEHSFLEDFLLTEQEGIE